MKRVTAEYFEWDTHFDDYPAWVMNTRPQVPGGGWSFKPGPIRNRGGRRCHIYLRHSDWPTKDPKRVTFRIGTNVGLKELAELTHFTRADWIGVKELGGSYWSRQELEAIYHRI